MPEGQPIRLGVGGYCVDDVHRLVEVGKGGLGGLPGVVGEEAGEAPEGIAQQSCLVKFYTS